MAMGKTIGSIFIGICILVLAVAPLAAGDVYDEVFSWGLNLTETWVLLDYDTENGIVSFADQNGHAIMQVMVRHPDAVGDDAEAQARGVIDGLGAQADLAPFTFSGHSAALADATWTAGSIPVRGYIVTIDDKPLLPGARAYPYDYVLMVFSLEEEYDIYFDFLLSNLDGFAPVVDEYHMPGAVSQFIRATGGSQINPFAAEVPARPPLSMSPDRLNPMAALPLQPGAQGAVEAAWTTIEREGRILNQFAEAPAEIRTMAWRRYYQMLYKDSWYDMRPVAETIAGRLEAHNVMRSEYPSEILTWLQEFGYNRSGGISDVEPAWVCITNESGDCDSLALIFMAILDHLGIDNVLMISEVHAHAIVGVDTAGPGARFPFLDVNWLVAELTADVPIGMIAAAQADPADWFGFDLDFHPEW
jgi:hypothetical protein